MKKEKDFGPEASTDEGASVATLPCTVGNSIEQDRIIKFRAWDKTTMTMYYSHIGCFLTLDFHIRASINCEIMQFTGLNDKNGKGVYEGDIIRFRVPVRTTQTHYGDNIPNGSYTEPMEPGIKTIEGTVVFKDAAFVLEDSEEPQYEGMPIHYCFTEWDETGIQDAILVRRMVWDDPDEGDLQYLMEITKTSSLQDLIQYLNGVEVIGNIYENPECSIELPNDAVSDTTDFPSSTKADNQK